MKYSVESLIDRFNQKQRLKYIFFWGNTEKEGKLTKACFSQWYNCLFEIDGVTYHTAEQYMMSHKALLFNDTEVYDKIMKSNNPKVYKELGRQIRNFVQEVWDSQKYQIVVDGNYAKFSQNEKLKEYLLNTGDRVLVEASPYDRIWGIGLSADEPNIENPLIWRGENLLGFALMEARDKLR